LNDCQFAFDQSQNGDDEFNDIPEGCIEQSTEGLSESQGRFFRSESEKTGCIVSLGYHTC
jgi:hypothetical protein